MTIPGDIRSNDYPTMYPTWQLVPVHPIARGAAHSCSLSARLSRAADVRRRLTDASRLVQTRCACPPPAHAGCARRLPPTVVIAMRPPGSCRPRLACLRRHARQPHPTRRARRRRGRCRRRARLRRAHSRHRRGHRHRCHCCPSRSGPTATVASLGAPVAAAPRSLQSAPTPRSPAAAW